MTASSDTRTLQFSIAADPPNRLDKALARDVPAEAGISRTQLARMIASNAVWRGEEALSHPRMAVQEGDVITIHLDEPSPSHIEPEVIPLDIAYEDDDLIVINKPAGMVVHPAPGARSGTLVNALLAHCGDSLAGIGGVERPGIVHRLDKDTSGLLVVAKTDLAHQALSAQFAARSAHRRYLAICYGVPNRGDARLMGLPIVAVSEAGEIVIDAPIGRHRHDRQRMAVNAKTGKFARTRLRVLEEFGSPGQAALISCKLETGRTHQIRVHMAAIGHPLFGDPVYGAGRKLGANSFEKNALDFVSTFSRQALHAEELGFTHPRSAKQHFFKALPPQDFLALQSALAKNQ